MNTIRQLFRHQYHEGNTPHKFHTVLLAMLLTLVMAGCTDKDEIPGQEPDSDPDQEIPFEPVKCAETAYITSGLPGDLQSAFQTCFPQLGQLGEARVAIFSNEDILADPNVIDRCYDLGGLVILIRPTEEAYDKLVEEYDHPDAMPEFPGNGILLFAYDRNDRSYSICEAIDGEEENGEEIPIEDPEELIKLGAGSNDDENLPDKSEAAEHKHDDMYLCGRLAPFVDWINEKMAEDDNERMLSRSSSDGYDPRADISKAYFEKSSQAPVKLHHKIRHLSGSDADYLDADGEIKVTVKIYPLFQFSQNGGDAPGDYYIVEATATSYNQRLWKCDYHTHGAMRDYIIGYYMKQLDVSYQLTDSATYIPDVTFYTMPQPANLNASQTYSKNNTVGFNAGVSFGKSEKNGWQWAVNGGFSMSWSNSVSYCLQDVATTLDSYGGIVSYRYTVQNLKNSMKYNKSKKGEGYPQLSRCEMTAPAYWVWKIPYGKMNVCDNSEKKFYITIVTNAKFGCYSWYRPKVTPKEDVFNIEEFVYREPIPNPDRTRFGVLALKNAGPYTVTNIEVLKKWRDGSFFKFADIPSSYNVNEVAKMKVPEGVYRLKFKTVDTGKDNQVTSKWITRPFDVTMGTDENSSTAEVSTVNAEKDN